MKHTFKDFIPLIIIFAVIISLTAFSVVDSGLVDMQNSMRLFMGYFFLVFGVFKTIKWSGFVMAYKEYDVLAKKSTLYAYTYPLIEIGLAMAFLASWNLVYVNVFTLVLMLVSVYGVWLKLLKKEEVPCACLGTVFKLPMTKVTLFEDLLMAVMAALILVL